MEQFFHSVEFYVILFTIASLAVGLIVKPQQRGEAETSFEVATMGANPGEDSTPRLMVKCMPNGVVMLQRCGLSDVTDSATVALAITRIGFDLTIEERVTAGVGGTPAGCATFLIAGLAQERYHVKYNSSAYSTFVSFSLTNHPGISFTRNFPA